MAKKQNKAILGFAQKSQLEWAQAVAIFVAAMAGAQCALSHRLASCVFNPCRKTISILAVVGGLVAGLMPARSFAAEPRRVVMMIGEDEYSTWETLPEFAGRELKSMGAEVIIIHSDAHDKNGFTGLVAALERADLLVLSVRRRTPRRDELAAIRAYLAAGKPLVGIRTACHAFALAPNEKGAGPNYSAWPEFDPEVLGGHYTGHYRADPKGPIVTQALIAPGAASHAILRGLSVEALSSEATLYKVGPLEPGANCLLLGRIPGNPEEPIAWIRRYGPKEARIFYTSLGAASDFRNVEFRKLLKNAIDWALRL